MPQQVTPQQSTQGGGRSVTCRSPAGPHAGEARRDAPTHTTRFTTPFLLPIFFLSYLSLPDSASPTLPGRRPPPWRLSPHRRSNRVATAARRQPPRPWEVRQGDPARHPRPPLSAEGGGGRMPAPLARTQVAPPPHRHTNPPTARQRGEPAGDVEDARRQPACRAIHRRRPAVGDGRHYHHPTPPPPCATTPSLGVAGDNVSGGGGRDRRSVPRARMHPPPPTAHTARRRRRPPTPAPSVAAGAPRSRRHCPPVIGGGPPPRPTAIPPWRQTGGVGDS